jgi:hypothetical protein
MGIISRIERKLEHVVEYPFSTKQQLDLAALEIALNRLVEKEKVNVLGVYMVPAFYSVVFDHKSFRDYEPFFDRLSLRIEDAMIGSFKEKGYKTAGDLCVSFLDGSARGGIFFVSCQWKNPNGNDHENASVNIDGRGDGSYRSRVASFDEKGSNQNSNKEGRKEADQRETEPPRLINKSSGDSFIIDPTPFIIGRGTECHMILNDEAISGRHAQISKSYSKLILEDLRSTNGTRVNRRYVKKVALQDGDEVIIGNDVLIVKTADRA